MTPDQNARRNYMLHSGAFVAKNSWWEAKCPKHGVTQHLSVHGGACVECHKEKQGEGHAASRK